MGTECLILWFRERQQNSIPDRFSFSVGSFTGEEEFGLSDRGTGR
jgi:hypothetical protein